MKQIARPGDCVLKIAAHHGLPWQRIWNHPENRALTDKRENPGILQVGDEVFVPEKEPREENCDSERRHRFVKKTVWAWIRMNIESCGAPRAGEPYYVRVGDRRYDGTEPKTDPSGLIQCRIPACADNAVVVLGRDENEEYELYLGYVDPADTPQGLHGRLKNLGLYEGEVDSPYDDESRFALRSFLESQGKHDPDVSARNQAVYASALKNEYGS